MQCNTEKGRRTAPIPRPFSQHYKKGNHWGYIPSSGSSASGSMLSSISRLIS